MKILLVEDDESLADVLMRHLKMQHYHVDLATDGQTAWDMATAFSYDLLLLDVMPLPFANSGELWAISRLFCSSQPSISAPVK
jgi:DNA-binding response OmpR family regulator